MVKSNTVYLRGLFQKDGAVAGQAMTLLPYGVRPSKTLYFEIPCSDNPYGLGECQLEIGQNGIVLSPLSVVCVGVSSFSSSLMSLNLSSQLRLPNDGDKKFAHISGVRFQLPIDCQLGWYPSLPSPPSLPYPFP